MEQVRRIALVTGAARGLGKRIAEDLSNKGYRIVVLDIQKSSTLPVAYRAMISEYHRVDLANAGAVSSLVDGIIRRHHRVDVLVNNAAVRLFKRLLDFSQSEIERYININLRVPILLAQRLSLLMIKNGYGRIINISSASAFYGYSRGSMYCCTKSALEIFTEAFGKELNVSSDDVTINVIRPDSFSTVEGKMLKGHQHIIHGVSKIISDILSSKRNAEIIPVLTKRTKYAWTIRRFKDDVQLWTKY